VGALLFLVSAASKSKALKRLRNSVDIACIAALTAATLYLAFSGEEILFRVTPPTMMELLCGAALLVVTLEAARRSSGLVLPVTPHRIFALRHGGPLFTGFIETQRLFSFAHLFPPLYDIFRYTTSSDIYGIPLGVSAT
jgi:TRAP-type uncharacterized transport system fused permease subunit